MGLLLLMIEILHRLIEVYVFPVFSYIKSVLRLFIPKP